jgi:hypothetical protein
MLRSMTAAKSVLLRFTLQYPLQHKGAAARKSGGRFSVGPRDHQRIYAAAIGLQHRPQQFEKYQRQSYI